MPYAPRVLGTMGEFLGSQEFREFTRNGEIGTLSERDKTKQHNTSGTYMVQKYGDNIWEKISPVFWRPANAHK